MIKTGILVDCRFEIVDAEYDGILCVKYISKTTDFTFIIFSCFLPPENSVWGRDAQSNFAHILTNLYINNDDDAFIVYGDFNARIGSFKDFSEFHTVPNRSDIDKQQISTDKRLLNF